MKIQNDEIVVESADVSQLSDETQSALASSTNNRTIIIRLPAGSMTPAEYLSAVLNQLLDSARRAQSARRFNTLREALEDADPSKRRQAEALIEQAEAAVGVEQPIA